MKLAEVTQGNHVTEKFQAQPDSGAHVRPSGARLPLGSTVLPLTHMVRKTLSRAGSAGAPGPTERACFSAVTRVSTDRPSLGHVSTSEPGTGLQGLLHGVGTFGHMFWSLGHWWEQGRTGQRGAGGGAAPHTLTPLSTAHSR